MSRLYTGISFLLLFLVACAPTASPAPTATLTATPTVTPTTIPTATSTSTPEPTSTSTPTPTPLPVQVRGRLFLDANMSGLQDETSFNYPDLADVDHFGPFDLNELVTRNGIDASALQEGDLVTIMEPGLPGYKVCTFHKGDRLCTTTDAEGDYSLELPTAINVPIQIEISDPYSGDVEREMRYINLRYGPVTIPEDPDNEIPAHVVNDTKLLAINEGVSVGVGEDNQVGLMQGAILWCFLAEQFHEPFVFAYFDIDGDNFLSGDWIDNQNGRMLSYNGLTSEGHDGRRGSPREGVFDANLGMDVLIPKVTI